MKRKLQIIATVFALAFAMTACAGEEKKEESTVTTESEVSTVSEMKENTEEKTKEKVFTLDELAAFNGKDGAKAYVAVNGVVYDVTGIEAWSEGKHNGVEAGKDLTEAIQKAPHGAMKVDGLPVVGKLAE